MSALQKTLPKSHFSVTSFEDRFKASGPFLGYKFRRPAEMLVCHRNYIEGFASGYALAARTLCVVRGLDAISHTLQDRSQLCAALINDVKDRRGCVASPFNYVVRNTIVTCLRARLNIQTYTDSTYKQTQRGVEPRMRARKADVHILFGVRVHAKLTYKPERATLPPFFITT